MDRSAQQAAEHGHVGGRGGARHRALNPLSALFQEGSLQEPIGQRYARGLLFAQQQILASSSAFSLKLLHAKEYTVVSALTYKS